jgi:glycine/D-amino acid oxidase-like deaminating enzyme
MSESPDVVIVGAGMVGASCAYAAASAGLNVTVIDRSGVVSGTTGAGEGNILVSDKEPGPELDLALWSNDLWRDWGDQVGAESIELEPKGGLVVATQPDALAALGELAAAQSAAGVESQSVAGDALRDLEPRLSRDLAGGVFYAQDAQVQPMLAATRLLRAARDKGCKVLTNTELTGLVAAGGGAETGGGVATGGGAETGGPAAQGRLTAVETTSGTITARHVVNAAGTWGGEVSARLGAPVPVLPRRGFILVTEPLPERFIRHKVYTADYVANVASSDEGLETSTVIESTRSGTVLIGASRERVGFDRALSVPVFKTLARGATRLFPDLERSKLLRVYRGFRPYCPDHLPVIGADPRVDGVWHACGHEGAGIGLAPATGALIAALITGERSPVDPRPFSPERFVP